MACGSTTFTFHDIAEAVKWGTTLKLNGVYCGKKSGEYPNGRFPHFYIDEDFTFNDHCPADEDRLEYPILLGDVYNGGISTNDKYGKHRVIFYPESAGDPATGSNPVVYFCGGVTHEGATEEGKFLQCTVH